MKITDDIIAGRQIMSLIFCTCFHLLVWRRIKARNTKEIMRGPGVLSVAIRGLVKITIIFPFFKQDTNITEINDQKIR